jgi:tetratricopeptide (TPR) repeat protein
VVKLSTYLNNIYKLHVNRYFHTKITIIYTNKAAAYLGFEQYDKAKEAADKAIEADPNLSMAYANKGMALIGLEKYQDALNAAEKAIKLNPDNHFGHYVKGLALDEDGKLQEALESLDKSLKLNPDFSEEQSSKNEILGRLAMKKLFTALAVIVILGLISARIIILIVKRKRKNYAAPYTNQFYSDMDQ